jgi:hypothetical protein
MYNAATNPHGTRCTLQDYNVAALGRRSDGRANGILDDVGVEWGLAAVREGAITAEQFVDLNEKVGGWTIDHQHQARRTLADLVGIERMYSTGQLTAGRNLGMTPSIDVRSDDTADLHGNVFREALRARVRRAARDTSTQVFWTEPLRVPSGVPSAQSARRTFTLMDAWLAAMEADSSTRAPAQKAVADRPRDARDACVLAGVLLPSREPCDAVYTHHRLARGVAGMPLASDVLKCALTPLVRAQVGVVLTDEQWRRLLATFPTGVCDYGRPGQGQRAPLGTWISLAGPNPSPMGPAPVARSAGFAVADGD